MFKQLLKLSKLKKQQEEAQGLVEYALILVLVAVVVIVILSQMGPAVGNIFSTVVSALNGNTEVGDVCLGDLAPPTEYYLFVGGSNIIEQPAPWYSDSDCTVPAGSNNITVIHSSVSESDADQICQDRHSVDATTNAPGDIWYCS